MSPEQQCEFDDEELDQASPCDHDHVYNMQHDDLNEGTMQSLCTYQCVLQPSGHKCSFTRGIEANLLPYLTIIH